MDKNKRSNQSGHGNTAAATLTILGCITIFAVLAAAIIFIGHIYATRAESLVYEIVDGDLKQNVHRIVADIDLFRESELEKARKHIAAFGQELSCAASSPYDLVAGPSGDAWRFENLVFAVWDESGALAYTDIPADLESPGAFLQQTTELLGAYQIFSKGDGQVLCGIPMDVVDRHAKEYIYKKIHSIHYDDNSYFWVNEVLNFDGGDGYAIRRIHPNLKDTEGMPLSTDMQDVAGGYPYLEELEGIKENGEILYSYYFKLLNEDVPALKQTYACLYEPYNWIICMGTYVQDMKAYTADIRNLTLTVSAVSILIIATLLLGMIAGILKQARKNARSMANLEAEHRLNRTKEAIFSSLSHDMRTPLNAIIGFSNLAGQEECPPKVKDYLGKIHVSGNVLLNLVSDTLAISRINDGTHSIEKKPFHFSELVEECLVVSSASAAERGVRLIAETPEKDFVLLGDQNAIQEVFMNLVSNAVKYTPAGGTVTLKFAVSTASGRGSSPPYDGSPEYADYVMNNAEASFTVQDTGIGMSKEFINHMFEPFTQENPASALKHGVGLGLAIVKQLVDLMGGDIEVRSVKGKGSSFRVTIRLWRLMDSVMEDPASPSEEWEANTDADVSGIKVLLCEDNELNRELAIDILDMNGIEVVCAENGAVGCERFKESALHEFSAILMDLRMPVMDGYEAAGVIRAAEREDAASIPIIAVSADAFEEDKLRSFEAGMNAHVAKPIDVEELMRILKSLVQPSPPLSETR